jgi:hypothetical protein
MVSRFGTKTLSLVAALLAVTAVSAGARADVTLTFDPLAGFANEAPFTGETEQGFTVTPTAGSFFVGNTYGNPVPSIFAGPVGSPTVSTILVTAVAAGGTFDFESIDVSSNNGTSGLTIVGTRNGNNVFTETVTAPNAANTGFTFTTINTTNTGLIDALTVTIDPTGGPSSINFDNIHLSTQVAVPEPSTLATSVLALGLFGGYRRFRRDRA